LEAKALKSVGGDLCIYANAQLEAKVLKSVGGDLRIYAKIGHYQACQLYQKHKGHNWYLSDKSDEYLLRQDYKEVQYQIGGVIFDRILFDKVRKDELTAQEVFAVKNMEQRRIAYEKMDKKKMAELSGLKVLDERTDKYNNRERIISFNLPGYREPFLYFNCVCPSTGREYYLETRQASCQKAKAASFGFEDIVFDEEC
jgi:hypothetical protein